MFRQYVIEPFLDVLANAGGNNALCINERFYTYNELAQHISKLRKALRSSGKKGKNIGLVTNDDLETYASVFACWLEGLAYVPLHHQQPKDRSNEIIAQAGVEVVINSISNNPFAGVQNIESSSLTFEELMLEPVETSDDALAYILFTSGSTGKPKGVPIKRSCAGAFMKAFWETGFEITAADKCLQGFELTFDISVQNYIMPLTRGACLYTIPHTAIKYSYAYGLMEDHELTFAVLPPSLIRFLRPYFEEINIPSMRYCILSAEASTLDLVEAWKDCIPNAEISDFYGPTEATIYCTYSLFNRNGGNKQLNGLLSIGKPMNGVDAIIIDENRNILGPNAKGELCVSGAQLTDGYLNNPEKNKESFFEINRNGRPTRFYKTGDLCYFDDDGDIMYSGRLDYQVKIQGYRIELGEIEYHARESINGRNAVAVTFQNNAGHTEIALFVEGQLDDHAIVINHLKTRVPPYMIPTKFISQESFPLNTNGKVDRNQLKVLIA